MGCDIHFKAYLYDKNSDDYVDIDIINQKLDKDNQLPELVGNRYYDLFGLFGNDIRSRFPFLEGLTEGYPAFFEEKDPEDAKCEDWYGYTHINPIVLKDSLKKYQNMMNTGNIFLLNNDEEVAEIEKRIYYKKEKWHGYSKPFSAVDSLSNEIDRIVKSIDSYYKISKLAKFKMICDLAGYDFDIDKTEFIFWFDN